MKLHSELEPQHIRLIEQSPLFFVATAGPDGRVNVSPKGLDCLRVLSAMSLSFMNLTGSGNETAGHLLLTPRITLMWCSFGPKPAILRTYGTGRAVHPGDPDWADVSAPYPEDPANRQVIVVEIERVQTSCGYAVPRMTLEAERDTLTRWAQDKGPEGLAAYRMEKNRETIDGYPTGLPGETT